MVNQIGWKAHACAFVLLLGAGGPAWADETAPAPEANATPAAEAPQGQGSHGAGSGPTADPVGTPAPEALAKAEEKFKTTADTMQKDLTKALDGKSPEDLLAQVKDLIPKIQENKLGDSELPTIDQLRALHAMLKATGDPALDEIIRGVEALNYIVGARTPEATPATPLAPTISPQQAAAAAAALGNALASGAGALGSGLGSLLGALNGLGALGGQTPRSTTPPTKDVTPVPNDFVGPLPPQGHSGGEPTPPSSGWGDYLSNVGKQISDWWASLPSTPTTPEPTDRSIPPSNVQPPEPIVAQEPPSQQLPPLQQPPPPQAPIANQEPPTVVPPQAPVQEPQSPEPPLAQAPPQLPQTPYQPPPSQQPATHVSTPQNNPVAQTIPPSTPFTDNFFGPNPEPTSGTTTSTSGGGKATARSGGTTSHPGGTGSQPVDGGNIGLAGLSNGGDDGTVDTIGSIPGDSRLQNPFGTGTETGVFGAAGRGKAPLPVIPNQDSRPTGALVQGSEPDPSLKNPVQSIRNKTTTTTYIAATLPAPKSTTTTTTTLPGSTGSATEAGVGNTYFTTGAPVEGRKFGSLSTKEIYGNSNGGSGGGSGYSDSYVSSGGSGSSTSAPARRELTAVTLNQTARGVSGGVGKGGADEERPRAGNFSPEPDRGAGKKGDAVALNLTGGKAGPSGLTASERPVPGEKAYRGIMALPKEAVSLGLTSPKTTSELPKEVGPMLTAVKKAGAPKNPEGAELEEDDETGTAVAALGGKSGDLSRFLKESSRGIKTKAKGKPKKDAPKKPTARVAQAANRLPQ